MSRSVEVTVRYLEVEVPLEDISDEDLLAELACRESVNPADLPSSVPPLSGEETHPLHEIYYAFKFGLNYRAMELARAYVCDELGVIL